MNVCVCVYVYFCACVHAGVFVLAFLRLLVRSLWLL